MKNKKTVYFLLPVVTLIWGIVFYRIFSATHSSDDNNMSKDIPLPYSRPDHSRLDTFNIFANYRDPFVGRINSSYQEPTERVEIRKNEPPVKPPEKIVQPIKWPAIIYGGMIKNQKSNKQLVLVQINGQDKLMQEGNMVSGVELIRIFKDSIELAFEKEKKIIKNRQ